MLIQSLQQKLLDRAETNSLRKLSVSKGMIDFSSNDYLGLAQNESLTEKIKTEFNKLKGKLNGSTGSRLLSGNDELTMQVEKYLAQIFQAESALLFNSGYNANLAILSSIPQKGDTILYDELIHASLKDGYRLSFASRFPFRHNNLVDLEAKLKKAKGTIFVVIESVYSMDGDHAPLKEIIRLCEQYHAYLIVDEAHSTGTAGENGSGISCLLEIEQKIFARIYTFGKAMGVHGACIVGSKIMTDYLINFARPFIYTTSLPPHSIIAIRSSFEYLSHNLHLQKLLEEKITLFRSLLVEKSLDDENYIKSNSPIQILRIKGNSEVKKVATNLQSKKLDVRPILSPTVKEGEERIRICLHAFNTEEEIRLLTDTLQTSIHQ